MPSESSPITPPQVRDSPNLPVGSDFNALGSPVSSLSPTNLNLNHNVQQLQQQYGYQLNSNQHLNQQQQRYLNNTNYTSISDRSNMTMVSQSTRMSYNGSGTGKSMTGSSVTNNMSNISNLNSVQTATNQYSISNTNNSNTGPGLSQSNSNNGTVGTYSSSNQEQSQSTLRCSITPQKGLSSIPMSQQHGPGIINSTSISNSLSGTSKQSEEYTNTNSNSESESDEEDDDDGSYSTDSSSDISYEMDNHGQYVFRKKPSNINGNNQNQMYRKKKSRIIQPYVAPANLRDLRSQRQPQAVSKRNSNHVQTGGPGNPYYNSSSSRQNLNQARTPSISGSSVTSDDVDSSSWITTDGSEEGSTQDVNNSSRRNSMFNSNNRGIMPGQRHSSLNPGTKGTNKFLRFSSIVNPDSSNKQKTYTPGLVSTGGNLHLTTAGYRDAAGANVASAATKAAKKRRWRNVTVAVVSSIVVMTIGCVFCELQFGLFSKVVYGGLIKGVILRWNESEEENLSGSFGETNINNVKLEIKQGENEIDRKFDLKNKLLNLKNKDPKKKKDDDDDESQSDSESESDDDWGGGGGGDGGGGDGGGSSPNVGKNGSDQNGVEGGGGLQDSQQQSSEVIQDQQQLQGDGPSKDNQPDITSPNFGHRKTNRKSRSRSRSNKFKDSAHTDEIGSGTQENDQNNIDDHHDLNLSRDSNSFSFGNLGTQNVESEDPGKGQNNDQSPTSPTGSAIQSDEYTKTSDTTLPLSTKAKRSLLPPPKIPDRSKWQVFPSSLTQSLNLTGSSGSLFSSGTQSQQSNSNLDSNLNSQGQSNTNSNASTPQQQQKTSGGTNPFSSVFGNYFGHGSANSDNNSNSHKSSPISDISAKKDIDKIQGPVSESESQLKRKKKLDNRSKFSNLSIKVDSDNSNSDLEPDEKPIDITKLLKDRELENQSREPSESMNDIIKRHSINSGLSSETPAGLNSVVSSDRCPLSSRSITGAACQLGSGFNLPNSNDQNQNQQQKTFSDRVGSDLNQLQQGTKRNRRPGINGLDSFFNNDYHSESEESDSSSESSDSSDTEDPKDLGPNNSKDNDTNNDNEITDKVDKSLSDKSVSDNQLAQNLEKEKSELQTSIQELDTELNRLRGEREMARLKQKMANRKPASDSEALQKDSQKSIVGGSDDAQKNSDKSNQISDTDNYNLIDNISPQDLQSLIDQREL